MALTVSLSTLHAFTYHGSPVRTRTILLIYPTSPLCSGTHVFRLVCRFFFATDLTTYPGVITTG